MIALARRALLAGLLTAPAAVYAERFAGKYTPAAQPVADGVWLVRGADEPIAFANGGAIANSVIIASAAGAIVIDPGPSLAYGRALAALANQLTGAPAGLVLITHLHPDHAFGAGAFAPAIVKALPGTAEDLARNGAGFSDAMYRMLADWMTGTDYAAPVSFVDDGPLVFGGRTLDLLALSGHSGADLAVLDRGSGTLIAGDLVFHDRAPSTPHANLARWRTALDTLSAMPHTRLIPGHGPLDPGTAAIAQTRDWLDWLEPALRTAVQGGLDMTEAGALPIPPRFAALKAARYELQRSVSHFYPALEGELLPRADG